MSAFPAALSVAPRRYPGNAAYSPAIGEKDILLLDFI